MACKGFVFLRPGYGRSCRRPGCNRRWLHRARRKPARWPARPLGGVDRRNGCVTQGRVRRDYGQVDKTEILHGPRRRADVVRITRADKYDSSTSHFPEGAFVSLRRRPEKNENQPRRNEEHEERSEKSSCPSFLRG